VQDPPAQGVGPAALAVQPQPALQQPVGVEPGRADALRRGILHTAGASDFAEYVDPHTGQACGATGFGWTAALTLDLLHDRPAWDKDGVTAIKGEVRG
jgi:hypothetical protein